MAALGLLKLKFYALYCKINSHSPPLSLPNIIHPHKLNRARTVSTIKIIRMDEDSQELKNLFVILTLFNVVLSLPSIPPPLMTKD